MVNQYYLLYHLNLIMIHHLFDHLCDVVKFRVLFVKFGVIFLHFSSEACLLSSIISCVLGKWSSYLLSILSHPLGIFNLEVLRSVLQNRKIVIKC